MKSAKLNVIADDLGIAESVNDGIVFLLKEKKINGASLMTNGVAFDDALVKIANLPDANIGIHLVLVEEESVSDIKLEQNYKLFFVKYIFGLISLESLEKEVRAQMEKCISVGIKPRFINSHRHLHLLPGIMNIAVKLAKEYQIPRIRVVNEPVNFSGGRLFRKSESLFLNFLSRLAKRKIKKAGLGCNDFFVGFVNAGNISKNDVAQAERLSEKYPDKTIELNCHPGYEDEVLRAKYKKWGEYHWQDELAVLKESGRP